jgi:hypothetical protein
MRMRRQHMRFKNFTTISTFFLTLVFINLFVSEPSKAMFDSENEMEKRKTTHVAPKDQKQSEEAKIIGEDSKLCPIPVRQDSPISILPDEILAHVFSFLHIDDLGRLAPVSRRWSKVCSTPQLWRKIGLENYRDYFTVIDLEENPKEKVIHHYLSVRQNALDAAKGAGVRKNFEKKYDLSSFVPTLKHTCLGQ